MTGAVLQKQQALRAARPKAAAGAETGRVQSPKSTVGSRFEGNLGGQPERTSGETLAGTLGAHPFARPTTLAARLDG